MGAKPLVLITGGAGYIGSHANKLLAARGYPTLVLDNLVYGHREFVRQGDFLLADLVDSEALDLIFKRYPIQAVMHFAAFAYVGESVSDPEKYYLNNVGCTLNLLRAMRKASVETFIFSSTCATYGVPQEVPIPESHPQAPINPYGATKLMIERILQDYAQAYGLKYASLRYFNAAGADPDGEIGEDHDPETHLIPLVMYAALGRRPSISVFGNDYPTADGSCVRDYIHVTDLADAHVLALEYLLNGGESVALNLGNGGGYSVLEVVEEARRVTGREIVAETSPRRPGDPPALVGSADRARSLLGWNPQYADLPTILETAWNWHKLRHGRG